jgi:hypothetical protein
MRLGYDGDEAVALNSEACEARMLDGSDDESDIDFPVS